MHSYPKPTPSAYISAQIAEVFRNEADIDFLAQKRLQRLGISHSEVLGLLAERVYADRAFLGFDGNQRVVASEAP